MLINNFLLWLFQYPGLHWKIERFLDTDELLDKARLNSLGLFDENWYKSQYPDITQSGCNAYVHYMLFGWEENREISPLFAINDLKSALQNAKGNPINALRQLEDSLLAGLIDKIQIKQPQVIIKPINDQRKLLKGINLIGYLTSEIGLGQSIRNIGAAMDAAEIPCSFIDDPLPQRSNDKEYQTKCSLIQKHLANFVVCGIDGASHFYEKCEPGRVNYLYPFWELSKVPPELKQDLSKYEGFFAPSQFIADSFSQEFNRHIPLIRQPVKSRFEYIKKPLGDNVLKIIAFLDFDSYVSRKNPRAVLEAFLLAFPRTDDSVVLTVKVRGNNDRGGRELLSKYAKSDKRIRVIDKTISRSEMDNLIASADVYISMHRSEGFGFGPAEALALGKVVVATDYSGTKDFISSETGFPVAYDLVKVEANEYPFSADQVWANPSIDHAAKCLQDIHANWDQAQLKGVLGLEFMKQHYTPLAVSRHLKQVLKEFDLI